MEDLEMIEPVIIWLGDDHWVHPDIKTVVAWDQHKIEDGSVLDGLTRVWIENNDKTSAQLVIYSQSLEDGKISLADLRMLLEVTLFEDVWMPGGEQFCFTEFGQKMYSAFGDEMTISYASPDVSVWEVDGEYGFDT